MQQYEFQTMWTSDATVKIPHEVAAHLLPDRPFRVVLLVPDHEEDQEWSSLSAEEFLRGYADSDAIYDDLSPR